MHSLFRLLGIIAIVLMASSCARLNSGLGGALNLDTDFTLEVKADKSINPDNKHDPSPLIIRMYELSADKAFLKATFLEIYEKDKEVLGGDLLAKHEMKRLIPGEVFRSRYVLSKKTRYVGLFAEFSQYKDAHYKLVIPVVQNNVIATEAIVKVFGNNIAIDSGSSS